MARKGLTKVATISEVHCIGPTLGLIKPVHMLHIIHLQLDVQNYGDGLQQKFQHAE